MDVRLTEMLSSVGISELLRAAWLAGILPILIASIGSNRLCYFHGALLGFAKRGKIMQSSSYKFTVPQRFFLHFYVVAVVWTTFLLLITWFYAYEMESPLTLSDHKFTASRSVFLLLLMEVQVLRRLYETIYVFDYSPSARMHILGYFTGLLVMGFFIALIHAILYEASFYTAAPLSFCSICAPEIFNFAFHRLADSIVKDRDEVPVVEFYWWGYVQLLSKLEWVQWIGATVFIWGWIHQSCCHAILGSLRTKKEHGDRYVIPYGDWFKYVSSPHYLAEIVIYGGLLFASGGSDLTIWLLFGFVVSNLVFAATETHRWYIQKFDMYPRNRCAIFPSLSKMYQN